MRLQHLAAWLSLALCVVTGARDVVRAEPVPRVLSETNGQLVVDFVESGAPSGAPVARFFVAISNEGGYSFSLDPGAVQRVVDPARFLGGESVDSLRARAGSAADTVRVYSPFLYRGTRVVYFEVNLYLLPAGTDEVYQLVGPRLTVNYDPAPATNTAQTADPMLRSLVVNNNVFPTSVRANAPDPWFSLAQQWVKIPITARGVYAITGFDLQSLGIAPTAIANPSTLRMFSLFGQDQPRTLADPEGSWNGGGAMRETALLVEDGGDGVFNLTDRVIFYAVGPEDWADYYDPTAPDTLYHRHARAKSNYYYLTWDSSLPGAPRRVSEAPGAPGAGPFVTTHVRREYFEKDRVQHFDFLGDGWLWLSVPKAGPIKRFSLETVAVSSLDASKPQTFRTVALAEYHASRNDHRARYLVRHGTTDVLVAEKTWTTSSTDQHFEDGLPVRASGYFLENGANPFSLDVPTVPNPEDEMFFAWFSVFYHRFLAASNNRIGFTSADTTGTVTFELTGFDASPQAYVFDVTDATTPVRLTGAAAAGAVRFGYDFSGARRHFWVAKPAGLLTPTGMLNYTAAAEDLRADATGANMIIITHDSFRSSAQRLAAHREGNLPYYDNPRVKVVTTREIFDNFSGGMPDAMAIRNYIKFMHDRYADANNNPTLAYVLLFGDSNDDFRNNVSTLTDFVPSNLYFTRLTDYTFVTDEWFGHLDERDMLSGFGVLDVAIGRLPVGSTAEARIAVDKVIAYETEPTFGDWRKTVVLVADDELSSNEFACDVLFTSESEWIAYAETAGFIDVHKIYLTEFPRVSGIKPKSRAAFLEEWNTGALIINYIGHGSSQQMADEQVFLGTDVGLLDNGSRLPLLLGLSCTIGDFANHQAKSLSEKLILRETGGVIGAVTASRETYAAQNERLDFAIFEGATPRRLGEEQPPVGETLVIAKLKALVLGSNFFNQEENNWKYNLLTDPALRLRTPRHEVRFEAGASDTLVAGVRKTIRGAVYDGGAVKDDFGGSVHVVVREPDIDRQYRNECRQPQIMSYRVPGGVLYDGTTDVVDGRFEVTFRVPRSARSGPLAFITAYAEGATDAAATLDSALVVVEPTAADSLELRPRDGAPRVVLGFKSGLKTVKPGETLQAVVRDADGINILDTTNEGRQALLFDNLPVPIDANEFFQYDHGGADTSGVLLYPLSELTFGEHRAIYKVSDAFGQTTLDTLVFSVTDPQDYFADVLLNYPNPFKTSTNFLIRLSDRADIRLDIFTVSGRRVRRISQTHDGGEVWVPWDGRDAHGGEIANGIYLYVATIDFLGVDRPPLVARGKVSKIQ